MGDEVRRMGDEVRRMGSEVRRLGDEERSSAARCGRSENANGERVVVPARCEDYSGPLSERRRRTPNPPTPKRAHQARHAVQEARAGGGERSPRTVRKQVGRKTIAASQNSLAPIT